MELIKAVTHKAVARDEQAHRFASEFEVDHAEGHRGSCLWDSRTRYGR
jgi:hypothetical protein